MTAASPPLVNFGWRAPDFRLADTEGKIGTLARCAAPRALLVMFICNHCPYVQAVDRPLVARRPGAARRSASASPRSARTTPPPIPEDCFEKHAARSRASTASRSPTCTTRRRRSRAPTAPSARRTSSASTPSCELQYRGRLDDAGASPRPGRAARALRGDAADRRAPGRARGADAGIGCSIKWKAA